MSLLNNIAMGFGVATAVAVLFGMETRPFAWVTVIAWCMWIGATLIEILRLSRRK